MRITKIRKVINPCLNNGFLEIASDKSKTLLCCITKESPYIKPVIMPEIIEVITEVRFINKYYNFLMPL